MGVPCYFRNVSFPLGSVSKVNPKDANKPFINARGLPAGSDDFVEFGCKDHGALAAGVYDVLANIRKWENKTYFDLVQATPVQAK